MKIILTGTQAYGPAREDSDYDFVLLYYIADKLRQFLTEQNIPIQENSEINPIYVGFSFYLGTKRIQIICADNDTELARWEEATEMMKVIQPIENRDKRIMVFREFYNDLKKLS